MGVERKRAKEDEMKYKELIEKMTVSDRVIYSNLDEQRLELLEDFDNNEEELDKVIEQMTEIERLYK